MTKLLPRAIYMAELAELGGFQVKFAMFLL